MIWRFARRGKSGALPGIGQSDESVDVSFSGSCLTNDLNVMKGCARVGPPSDEVSAETPTNGVFR